MKGYAAAIQHQLVIQTEPKLVSSNSYFSMRSHVRIWSVERVFKLNYCAEFDTMSNASYKPFINIVSIILYDFMNICVLFLFQFSAEQSSRTIRHSGQMSLLKFPFTRSKMHRINNLNKTC